jgi:hypothetical protein
MRGESDEGALKLESLSLVLRDLKRFSGICCVKRGKKEFWGWIMRFSVYKRAFWIFKDFHVNVRVCRKDRGNLEVK